MASTLPPNMLNSCLHDAPKVCPLLIAGVKNQEESGMFSQLLDCDYFHGLELPNEHESAAISKRIYGDFYNPWWETSI